MSTKKNQTFDECMVTVTAIMVRKCGMGPDDLPDWRYHSAYDEGMSPIRAAASVLTSAKDSY